MPLSTFVLSNGLTLAVIPDHRWAVVAHMVWYRVGSQDEPHGKSGLAHLLEHMMFKGSGDIIEVVSRLGGEDNAFTSQDFTVYHQHVGSQHLGLMMTLEAARMKHLELHGLPEEQNVVLQERRSRLENNPLGVLWMKMDAALFAPHPYASPIIGSRQDILSATLEDVSSFHAKHYGPNNALVVVAGDVEPQEVLALAQNSYGTLSPRGVLEPPPPPPGAVTTPHLVHKDPLAQQTVLLRRYRLGESFNRWDKAFALDLFIRALSGGASSPLVRSLVERRQIATALSMGTNVPQRGPGSLFVFAVPAPGVSLSTLEEALDEELEGLGMAGLTVGAVAQAKARFSSELIYMRDDPFVLARAIGKALALGIPPERVRRAHQLLQAVSLTDINAAGQEALTHAPYVTGFLLPATQDDTTP